MKIDVTDLVERGLVHKKTYSDGPFKGLSVLKYTRKVFYDGLWGQDKRLLDCRGMVIDQCNNVIVYPFTKVFNYEETYGDIGAPDIPGSTLVQAIEKKNGFLGVVTNYKDKMLYSTTGSLDSDYSELVRKHVGDQLLSPLCSFMFEICDESDPHIIHEEYGAYLIGMRELATGRMLPEADLDKIAKAHNWLRPRHVIASFNRVRESAKIVEHEGFVIRDAETGEHLMKIKSPHYLTKKFLMRLKESKVEAMFEDTENFKKTVDEEFYGLVDYITSSMPKSGWISIDEQHRRAVIEKFIYKR